MIRRILRSLVCVCAAGASVLVAGPALAYTVGGGSSGTGPAGVAPGAPFTFTARFVDSNGNPITGTMVTFSKQSGPAGCQPSFSPVSAMTDANGNASTVVTLPAGCAGQFVLAGTLLGGGTVTLTVAETGGFPNTSAKANGGSRVPVAPLAALVLLLVGTTAGGIWLARARSGSAAADSLRSRA